MKVKKVTVPESNPRRVAFTELRCYCIMPFGVKYAAGLSNGLVQLEVSTVNLEGAHLEALIPRMLSPEYGFETMVFAGCDAMAACLYREAYKTRRAAKAGHARVVRRIIKRDLALAFPITYSAYEI